MELVDTHCHLNLLEHRPLEQIIADALTHRVTRMLCVGATDGIHSAKVAVDLAERIPEVWASIGIHPHDAGTHRSIEGLEEHLSHPRVVAVGETGLDFYRDWAPQDAQRELFINTIGLAKKHKKPLIIHCRDAQDETLEILKKHKAEEVGGVFHCYPSDAVFAAKLREINFLVSFTGILTFKKATALKEAARQIPLEQIMLETDCPYMAPEPFRGQPSEPMHVARIAEVLAEIKGIPVEEVAKATTENAQRLFGLSPT